MSSFLKAIAHDPNHPQPEGIKIGNVTLPAGDARITAAINAAAAKLPPPGKTVKKTKNRKRSQKARWTADEVRSSCATP